MMNTKWISIMMSSASFLFLFSNQVFSQSVKANSGLALQFEKTFSKLADKGKFNGTVLVAKNGKVLYRQAYGIANYKTNQKMKTDSIFNLASVSKPITATAILLLEKKGTLSLEDPIVKYLPGIKADAVTIKHLLQHTSGLADYMSLCDKYLGNKKIVKNEDVYELFKKYRPALRFKPGSKHEYSNTGYVFLSSIIQKVSGQSYHSFIDENILKPLNMDRTYTCTTDVKQHPDKTIGFKKRGKKYKENNIEYLDGITGDGNICSTVDDLLKFDMAMRNYKLISKKMTEEAYRPGKTERKKSYYGYGWMLYPSGSFVEHSGSWTGFQTYFGRDLEDGYTMIVLDNSSNSKLEDYVEDATEGFYD